MHEYVRIRVCNSAGMLLLLMLLTQTHKSSSIEAHSFLHNTSPNTNAPTYTLRSASAHTPARTNTRKHQHRSYSLPVHPHAHTARTEHTRKDAHAHVNTTVEDLQRSTTARSHSHKPRARTKLSDRENTAAPQFTLQQQEEPLQQQSPHQRKQKQRKPPRKQHKESKTATSPKENHLPKGTFCSQSGCTRHASYGPPGLKRALFCALHRSANDIDVKNKKCLAEGCGKLPSFGPPLKGTAEKKRLEYCVNHSPRWYVNLKANGKRKTRKCLVHGCDKTASFGSLSARIPVYCRDHRDPSDTDVRHGRCIARGCSKQPWYGIPGHRPTVCAEHAEEGRHVRVYHRDSTQMYSGTHSRVYHKSTTDAHTHVRTQWSSSSVDQMNPFFWRHDYVESTAVPPIYQPPNSITNYVWLHSPTLWPHQAYTHTHTLSLPDHTDAPSPYAAESVPFSHTHDAANALLLSSVPVLDAPLYDTYANQHVQYQHTGGPHDFTQHSHLGCTSLSGSTATQQELSHSQNSNALHVQDQDIHLEDLQPQAWSNTPLSHNQYCQPQEPIIVEAWE